MASELPFDPEDYLNAVYDTDSWSDRKWDLMTEFVKKRWKESDRAGMPTVITHPNKSARQDAVQAQIVRRMFTGLNLLPDGITVADSNGKTFEAMPFGKEIFVTPPSSEFGADTREKRIASHGLTDLIRYAWATQFPVTVYHSSARSPQISSDSLLHPVHQQLLDAGYKPIVEHYGVMYHHPYSKEAGNHSDRDWERYNDLFAQTKVTPPERFSRLSPTRLGAAFRRRSNPCPPLSTVPYSRST